MIFHPVFDNVRFSLNFRASVTCSEALSNNDRLDSPKYIPALPNGGVGEGPAMSCSVLGFVDPISGGDVVLTLKAGTRLLRIA